MSHLSDNNEKKILAEMVDVSSSSTFALLKSYIEHVVPTYNN